MIATETKISKLKLVSFGTITKTSGFKGELILKSELDYIPDTDVFFVETEGYIVPFFLASHKIKFQANNSVVIKFDSFNSEKEAESLLNCQILVREDSVIYETEDNGESYYAGFTVFNQKNEIGVVDSLMDIPGNPLLSVITKENKEVLIPLNEHFIIKINMLEKKIYFSLPEGLVDLN